MKRLALVIALAGLLVPATAAAATRLTHAEASGFVANAQADLCRREPACLEYEIGRCTRLAPLKFRCEVEETFGVRPQIRRCRYNAAVERFPNSVRVRDGYVRCYDSDGQLVAEGPAGATHPV